MTARRSTYDVLPGAPDPAAEAERAKHGRPWCDTCQRPSIGDGFGLQHVNPDDVDDDHEVSHQQWFAVPTTRARDLPLRAGDTLTVEEAEVELEPLTAEIACGVTVRQKAALRVLIDHVRAYEAGHAITRALDLLNNVKGEYAYDERAVDEAVALLRPHAREAP